MPANRVSIRRLGEGETDIGEKEEDDEHGVNSLNDFHNPSPSSSVGVSFVPSFASPSISSTAS
jgi:hypothetical protein